MRSRIGCVQAKGAKRAPTHSQLVSAEFEAKVTEALLQLENEGVPFTTTKLLKRADVNRSTLYTKNHVDGSEIHQALLAEIQKAKERVISKSKAGRAAKKENGDEPRLNDLLKKLKVVAGELQVLNAKLTAETQLREVAIREARRWATEAFALGGAFRRLCIAGATPSTISSMMGEIERRQLADVDEAGRSSDALLEELVVYLNADGGSPQSLRGAAQKARR